MNERFRHLAIASSSPARPSYTDADRADSDDDSDLLRLNFDSVFTDDLTLEEVEEIILREFPGEWAARSPSYNQNLSQYMKTWLDMHITVDSTQRTSSWQFWRHYNNVPAIVDAFIRSIRGSRNETVELTRLYHREVRKSVSMLETMSDIDKLPRSFNKILESPSLSIGIARDQGHRYAAIAKSFHILGSLIGSLPDVAFDQ